ncbi:MAG: hypothetical protein ACFFHV_05740 [Promethearchaeota archaeon]
MDKCSKLNKLKIILILIFITSFFLVSLIYVFLSDIPVLISLLDKYFSSGKSFFIPFIPPINVLNFLPEKYRIIRLTIGQLIDIYIISNLIAYIDSSFYHYLKNIRLNSESLTLTLIDNDSSKDDNDFRILPQNPGIIIGSEDQSKKKMNFSHLVFGKKRQYNFKNYLRKWMDKIIIIKNKKFKILSFNLYYFLRGFYNYSLFKVLSFLRLKDHYSPTEINFSDTLYLFFQEEGNNMKKIYLSFDFKKKFRVKLKDIKILNNFEK